MNIGHVLDSRVNELAHECCDLLRTMMPPVAVQRRTSHQGRVIGLSQETILQTLQLRTHVIRSNSSKTGQEKHGFVEHCHSAGW